MSNKAGKRTSKNKRRKVGSEHDIELSSNSVNDSGIDDDEILSQYEKSDHVPDRISAGRIARASTTKHQVLAPMMENDSDREYYIAAIHIGYPNTAVSTWRQVALDAPGEAVSNSD